MMQFKAHPSVSKRPSADVVIVPFFSGKNGALAALSPADLKSAMNPILKAGDFSGKEGATMLAYLPKHFEKRLLCVGLGEEKAVTSETLRRSYAAAMKRCQGKKWLKVNVCLPKLKNSEEVIQAIAEGMGLASYVFEEWKTKENQDLFHLKTLTFIGTSKTNTLQKVKGILSGVDLARDLVNRNALDITPQALAAEGRKLAKAHTSIKTHVLDKKQIEKEKMGLLLAVSKGSLNDPALIMVEYKGDPRSKEVSMVVGKGVTFDTGGLNLKPTNFIEDMRTDMGGGAAALGIIQAAAATKLKANIVAVIPSTENAIDAHSYKPGDVYRSYKGKTVEITNTDAEGRLILADALSYGQKRFSPTRIIDLATLTGAVVVALGSVRAGYYCNSESFAKQCMQAGEETGERVWRMPLDADYKKLLKSNIADIVNAAKKRSAGSVTAAIFLQEFIEKKTPWIHLDIAGTAYLDSPEHYHLTQATGAGVRLVTALLEKLA